MKSILCICLLLLSCVAITGCEHAQSQTPGQAPPPPPPKVEYTMPQVKQVTDHEDFTGHTAANNAVDVKAQNVSGYLVKVDFVDGAEVKKNDVLFELDDRTYVADLQNKEALVVQAQRHAERTKSNFDRAELEKKLNAHAISQEQYDQYRFDWIEAEAALQAATATRDLSKLNVEYTKVRAPISGRVGRRLVDPGNFVAPGTVASAATVLATIVSDDPIYGYFDVDEHTVVRLRRLVEQGKIKHSQDFPVSLAIWDETGFPHPGTVNFVDNRLDPQTGTIEFRGSFANHDHLLTPGLFIRVRLPVGLPHDALTIPEAALAIDQGRQFVYVINAKNEAVYTPVETGPQYPGELRVIESGLKTSDRVVVSGLQRVARSGMKVDPKEWKPADSPKSGEKTAAGAEPQAAGSVK
jgi:RND family efflux transporter MFP subunit